MAVMVLAWLSLSSGGGNARPAAPVVGPERDAREIPAASSPNVIFIVLDTARADRMSFNGYDRLTTPHLDVFARDAVVYRNAHSVAPWTLPSHMSMFTGLLPGQHGATWRAFATPDDASLSDILGRSFRFADSARLLPQRLRDLGYRTVGFSSNAWISTRTGFDVGFDHFYEMWKEEEPKTLRRAYEWLPPRLRAYLGWLPASMRTVSELDAGDGGQVLRMLEEHVVTHGALPQPFFLFFNFIDPHFPYSPPLSWRYAFSGDDELGEAIAAFRYNEMAILAGERPIDVTRFAPFYDAEIAYLDVVVGRLLGWLRSRGFYDDALIVVTSDHGEHLGEHGRFSHQFSVEEELLRIPLLIKYPQAASAGEVVETPLVSNVDVYETIVRAAGAQPQKEREPVSHDLGDMEGFERTHLIAESYFALPYLRLHRQKSARFSVEENAVVRRVVYDRSRRHVFLQRDGTTLVADSEGADPDRRAAEAVLLRYLQSLGEGRLEPTGQSDDPATRERLRALGYVN